MFDNSIIRNVKLGTRTKIWNFVNLYDCSVGEDCMIGSYVEIQADVKIGNNTRIQSHTFIPTGVTIEDNVFVGHHVVFVTTDPAPTIAFFPIETPPNIVAFEPIEAPDFTTIRFNSHVLACVVSTDG
jgi:acetyltransferase-like isoleucine patch superfamily enzyme